LNCWKLAVRYATLHQHTRHTSPSEVQTGEFSFFTTQFSPMNYGKPALTFQQQIQLLESRGLSFTNKTAAEKYLSTISYYRLSAYMLTFQVRNDPSHTYLSNATFEKILRLYQFDRELRLLLFDAIEKIEISLRTQIIYHLSHTYGAHWYTDASLFRSSLEHQNLIEKINDVCNANDKEVFITHYLNKYTNPTLPPSWMALETISFGQLSKIYRFLNTPNELRSIANQFGVDIMVLGSWLHSINYVRNICAHHSRIWNKLLAISPINPRRTQFIWLSNRQLNQKKIYFTLSVINYMLRAINGQSDFALQIKKLMAKYPEVPTQNMGFPSNWQNELLWS
jgi:abortive infection bacteriophage resistance protein